MNKVKLEEERLSSLVLAGKVTLKGQKSERKVRKKKKFSLKKAVEINS